MKNKKQIIKELKKEIEARKKLDRGNRTYNGLPSQLLHDIYDALIDRWPEVISKEWWVIFSLYLARSCGVVERKYRRKSVAKI